MPPAVGRANMPARGLASTAGRMLANGQSAQHYDRDDIIWTMVRASSAAHGGRMKIDAQVLEHGLTAYDPLSLGIEPLGYVLVDFTTYTSDPGDLAARSAAWLSRLPCPCVALTAEPVELAAFDIVADSRSELARVEAALCANPVASTVLMQALRIIETIDVHSGLVVESLAYATLQHGEEFQRWLANRPPPSLAGPPNAVPPIAIARRGSEQDIVLNRPEVRNEIDVEMRDALFEAFSQAALDEDLAEIHVRGAGDSFSIGGALHEFGLVGSAAAAHLIRTERLPARMLAEHGQRYHFHLHGACVGAGVEMAAFAGKVTAAPNTFFRLPEVSMGLIPGAGGCVSISRRIGRQRAAWMMTTGARVSARTALKWGLVDAIV